MCPAAVGKGSTECISTPDRRRSGVFHRFQNRSGKEYKYEDLCTFTIAYELPRNSRVGVDCQFTTPVKISLSGPAIRAWGWIASAGRFQAVRPSRPAILAWVWIASIDSTNFKLTTNARNSRVGVDCQFQNLLSSASRESPQFARGCGLPVPELAIVGIQGEPAIRAWVWIASSYFPL